MKALKILCGLAEGSEGCSLYGCTGQPVMAVTGWAAERLAQMTPEGHTAVIHCTLTDDHPWAQAFVVIEARAVGAVPT